VTVAAPALATAAERPARAVAFDSTWLLWIAINRGPAVLVVSPFVLSGGHQLLRRRHRQTSRSRTTSPPMAGRVTSKR